MKRSYRTLNTGDISRRLVPLTATLTCIIIVLALINAKHIVKPQNNNTVTNNTATNHTITLGLIIGTNSSAPRLVWAAKQAIDEINTYSQTQGTQYRFNLVEAVTSDPLQQFEAIQGFNSKGVKIMFCDWNSPICSGQSYMIHQNITMISLSDSHCRSHKQVDSIYRMSPNHTEETSALKATIQATGIKAVVVLKSDITNDYLSLILPKTGLDVEAAVEIKYSHTEADQGDWQVLDVERTKTLMGDTSSKLNMLLKSYKPSEVAIVYALSYMNENYLKAR
jgi:hypothetical protein